MTDYSDDLIGKLKTATVAMDQAQPPLLLEPGDIAGVRDRAHSIPGLVDDLAERARAASKDLFRPGVEDSYMYTHFRAVLKPLATSALVLEEERSAMRALEAIESYFSFPTRRWAPPERRDMRCHHAIPNSAALVGMTLDLCAGFW